jgi:hypothetical protein
MVVPVQLVQDAAKVIIRRFSPVPFGVGFPVWLTICALLLFAPALAHAHGGGPGLQSDPCLQATGRDSFIHLAAYQPDFDPFAEYCASVPHAGRTLLVLDLVGIELPATAVSLSLVQKNGAFRLSVPPRRYDSGIVELQADLAPGNYRLVVNVADSDEHHQIDFPVTVGEWWSRLITPLAIVMLVLLITFSYSITQIRRLKSERQRQAVKTAAEIPRRRA